MERLSSTAGRELRLETPSDDRNIVLAPDGIGRVIIESGNDQPALVAETGDERAGGDLGLERARGEGAAVGGGEFQHDHAGGASVGVRRRTSG